MQEQTNFDAKLGETEVRGAEELDILGWEDNATVAGVSDLPSFVPEKSVEEGFTAYGPVPGGGVRKAKRSRAM